MPQCEVERVERVQYAPVRGEESPVRPSVRWRESSTPKCEVERMERALFKAERVERVNVR